MKQTRKTLGVGTVKVNPNFARMIFSILSICSWVYKIVDLRSQLSSYFEAISMVLMPTNSNSLLDSLYGKKLIYYIDGQVKCFQGKFKIGMNFNQLCE